ncbi:hypothetical protein T12_15183 [Trichinella patagoniensis]|uniref:Uncharacterized protein n=1 Tax=Trichinella patagoniensis TaxID=990121 RepID=A0A0V0YXI5_9BILA|nr:hypothetical protein T12_15183 [Trichinella patagoniensis]
MITLTILCEGLMNRVLYEVTDTSVAVCRFAFRPTFARVVSFRSRQM